MTTTIIPPSPDAAEKTTHCTVYSWCDLEHVNDRGVEEFGRGYHSQTIVRTIDGHDYDWVFSLDEDGPYLYWDQPGYIEARTPAEWNNYLAAVASINADFVEFYQRYSPADATNRLRRDTTVTPELAERDV
jgi:hypothetical protein